MTMTSTRPVTAEELLEMGDVGRCELIRGEVIRMAPAGFHHGGITDRIERPVSTFVEQHKLGMVVAAETGFILSRNPDTVRAADVAFVQSKRIPPSDHVGFFEGPPDLAVEVISPSDRMSEVNTKVNEWLAAGTASVWVVDPPNESITIHRRDGSVQVYRGDDVLEDEPVLPGFKLKLKDVFRSP